MAPIPKPKRERTKHYFKEWREFRDLTQEQAMGRLGWSQSKLSRLEAGKTPFDQDDLEAAKVAYNCSSVSDLIEVNPFKEGDVVDLLSLLRSANEIERKAVISLLNTLKSGTGG